MKVHNFKSISLKIKTMQNVMESQWGTFYALCDLNRMQSLGWGLHDQNLFIHLSSINA